MTLGKESVENAHQTRMNDSTSNLEDGLSNSNDNFGSINDFVQEAISSHDDFLSLFSKFSEIVGNFDLPEDLPPHLCPLCHLLLTDPASLPCGHTICNRCSRSRRSCWCGKVFHSEVESQTKRNIVLGNAIQQIFPAATKSCAELVKLLDSYSSSFHLLEEAFKFDKKSGFVEPFFEMIKSRHHNAREEFRLGEMKAKEVIEIDPVLASGWALLAEALAGQNELYDALAKCLIAFWLDRHHPYLLNLCEQVFTKVKSIIEPQVMSSLDNPHAYVNGVLPGKRQRVEVRTTQENGSLGGPVGKLYCSSFSFSRSGDPICELAPTAKMPSFADDLTLGELRSKLSGNRIIQKVESVFPHDSNLPLHLGDLECPLCLRVYWNPDVTPCGHTFCSDCLERTLDHDPKCPLCKYSLADFTEAQRDQRFYDKHMQRLIKRWLPEDFEERRLLALEEEEEIKAKIPIFVCTLAFPCVPCPLHVFEPRHRLLLRRCIRSRNGEFGMNLPCISPGQLPYERNGTLLKVRNTDYFNDGRVVVDSVGVGRFKVQNNLIIDGYDAATVERVIDVPPRESDMGRLATLSTLVFQRALQWFESLPDDQSQALIRHYGEMPDRSTEQQEYANSDGPAWTWWVLAVIPAEDRIKLHVIGQTSLLNRLKLISRVITCIIQSQSTHPP